MEHLKPAHHLVDPATGFRPTPASLDPPPWHRPRSRAAALARNGRKAVALSLEPR